MFRSSVAVALTLFASGSALASAANHVVANYGNILVPFTHNVGNTFSGSQSTGFVNGDGTPVVYHNVGGLNYFYDDYVFTLPLSPQVDFNAAAVSIDLGSFLSLQNFSARLYKLDSGVSSLTTGLPSSGTPVQSWTSSSLLAPGVTGTTVLINNVALTAGATYALEFRGTINGSFGGSYGGNLNITPVSLPVPEPTTLALLFTSLGLIGVAGQRLKRQA